MADAIRKGGGMATLFELAGITAYRAHQAGASCAGSLPAQSLYFHQPNCAVKRTPTPSGSVPFCRCAPYGAAYLGR